ncbi:MAG: alcohol dehydrogenase catalytic domain-containing protein [Rhodobacter sp.]|nr:alcohol dehydrogenase catalytic domain-containing protein [Rhodobacter sp.]
MFATRLMRTGDIRLIEVPMPVPGPGEVLVRVLAAGICGTDRHLFLGEFPCTPPVTLGHEFTGTVAALGDGTDPGLLGRTVTCDPNIACGRCPPCLEGRVNLCTALQAVGVHRDGGFAEFAVFPAHRALVRRLCRIRGLSRPPRPCSSGRS